MLWSRFLVDLFLRATVISKYDSSNSCAKSENSLSPILSVVPSFFPFPLGSCCLSNTVAPDRHCDIMQDFTGLSLANTSRRWRGLWITSFTHAWRVDRTSILKPQSTTRKHKVFTFTCNFVHVTIKQKWPEGYMFKRWSKPSTCCLLQFTDLFTWKVHEVL